MAILLFEKKNDVFHYIKIYKIQIQDKKFSVGDTQAASSAADAEPASERKTTTDDHEDESEPLEDTKKGSLCHREHCSARNMS